MSEWPPINIAEVALLASADKTDGHNRFPLASDVAVFAAVQAVEVNEAAAAEALGA